MFTSAKPKRSRVRGVVASLRCASRCDLSHTLSLSLSLSLSVSQLLLLSSSLSLQAHHVSCPNNDPLCTVCEDSCRVLQQQRERRYADEENIWARMQLSYTLVVYTERRDGEENITMGIGEVQSAKAKELRVRSLHLT